jgi:hypothetical protein
LKIAIDKQIGVVVEFIQLGRTMRPRQEETHGMWQFLAGLAIGWIAAEVYGVWYQCRRRRDRLQQGDYDL